MRYGKGLSLGTLMLTLVLSACHKEKPKPVAPAAPVAKSTNAATSAVPAFPPLTTEPVGLKITQPGCKGRDCATFEAKWLRFPTEPVLSELVERNLVALGSQDKEPTVAEFAVHYLKQADTRWQMMLEAKVVRQQGPLIVVDLSVYDYSGGAHGNPADQLLNYDRAHQKALALADVLLPGQVGNFWVAAQKAHQAWVAPMLNDDKDYLTNWPFQKTDNFMLGDKGVVLKYSAYAIAPYSEGEPEITIPYADLKGIIKPEWVLGG